MTENERERIRALEVKVDLWLSKQSEMDQKLDDLLALRNKGMGAFFLASSLIGTGVLGFIGSLLGWFKL